MNKAMLIILDGFGIGEKVDSNARYMAKTPVIDKLMETCPTTSLQASGQYVGLPEGQIGNSEVGHLNIGAGRIVYQDLTRINNDIESGDFYKNEVLSSAMDGAKAKGKNLHLMGLVSKGGVHSSFDHLLALLKMAKKKGIENVYIHAFLDGRDVLPKLAYEDLRELEAFTKDLGLGEISTIVGRYYAMDRDKRWDRTEQAYRAMVEKEGIKAEDPIAKVKDSYDQGVTDEFVKAIVGPGKAIEKGDTVIFFNFRADRARQMTQALSQEDFDFFPAKDLDLDFVTMTLYDKNYKGIKVAYDQDKIVNTLGEYVSKKGLRQLRIAETEKYAHVTFFFNGGVEEANKGEDRILVNSPKVATYDLKPEMSAYEVTEKLLDKINNDDYSLIILNFANPDMVGHTGVEKAAIKAVEAVDECVGKIVEASQKKDYKVLITADHGNCEKMIDDDGKSPYTAHTTNKVPLIMLGDNRELKEGKLANLAPTLLDLMGLEKPKEMTEDSLIRR